MPLAVLRHRSPSPEVNLDELLVLPSSVTVHRGGLKVS